MASFSFYTHRKLLLSLNNTNNPTIQTCLNYCNKTLKTDTVSLKLRFCPQQCLAICPLTCQYTLFPPNTQPNTTQHHNLSPLLISMLILLALTFILITFYTLYTKLYSNFYQNNIITTTTTTTTNNSMHEEHVFHPIWYVTTVGLNPAVVNSIKVVKYEKGCYESDCVVCLGDFVIGDDIRILPKCNHVFHVHCIDTWLKSHVTCPLCRASIDIIVNNDCKTREVLTNSAIIRGDWMENDNELRNEEVGIHVNDNAECLEEKNGNKGSSSQRWSLERRAVSLVSRSLSCSGKIFSSRYNNTPTPNS